MKLMRHESFATPPNGALQRTAPAVAELGVVRQFYTCFVRATLFVLCVFLTGLDATNRALSAELANPLLGEWVIYDPATGAGGLCLQFKSDKTVWCRGFDARKPAERGELMWSATYDLRSTGTVFLSFDQSAPNAAPVPYKSKEYHYKINRQNVDGKNRSFLLLDVFPNALYFHFLE